MRIAYAALSVVSLTFASICTAQSPTPDYRAELLEWVFVPCMNVTAALQVNMVEEEHLDSGLRRKHLAQALLDERESALQQFVKKGKPASWEDRRKAYPVLLRMCLENATPE